MTYPRTIKFREADRLELKNRSSARFLASDKSGKVWEVMCIKAGLSKNRTEEGWQIYYEAEMLKRIIPLFENLPCHLYREDDGTKRHIRDQADTAKKLTGVVGNKIGVYKNPRWGKDAEGNEGVVADLHLQDDEFIGRLKNAWDQGFKDWAELSIDGDGDYVRDNIDGIVVARANVTKLISEDVVDAGAAGGKFLKIAASLNDKDKGMKPEVKRLLLKVLEARAKNPNGEKRITKFLEADTANAATVAAEVLQEQAQEATGNAQTFAKEALAAIQSGNADAAMAALQKIIELDAQEALKETEKAKEATPNPTTPDAKAKPDGTPTPNPEFQKLQEDLAALKKKDEEREAVAQIEASGLPTQAQEKIKESVRGGVVSPLKIKEAIDGERKYLEGMNLGFAGGSFNGISISDSGMRNIELALDGFWAGRDMVDEKNRVVPRFTHLKEAAIKGFRMDRDRADDPGLLLGAFSMSQYDSQLRRKFKESFTTANLDQVFGDSVHRAIMREFNLPAYRDFEKITFSEEVKDFRDHQYIRLGYWGELPVVDPDGGNYNQLVALADEQVAINLETRGGIFSITRKMIVNDDMNVIRALPTRAARALKLRPYRAVFDMLINNTVTSYDATALVHANHANNASGALDPTTFKEASLKMFNQKAYGSDATNPEYLMELNWPKWLVVHPDKIDIATALCKSQQAVQLAQTAGGYTAGQFLAKNEIPAWHAQFSTDFILCPRITNSSYWWAIADPSQVPAIAVATLRGQKEPEVTQEVQGSGSNFTAAKLSYRVSWDVGVKCVEHRGVSGYRP